VEAVLLRRRRCRSRVIRWVKHGCSRYPHSR
jgi:hypothetical protein